VAIEQANYNIHVIHLNNEFEIRRELSNIKADKKAYDILIQKMVYLHLKLEQIDTRAANILKQHIHAMGGEAAISKEAYSFTERTTDVLLSASRETLKHLAKKIVNLPYGLSKISKELEKNLFLNHGVMKCGEKIFDFRQKTYIMGILRFNRMFQRPNFSLDLLLRKSESMVKAGVNIIDISMGKSNEIVAKEIEKEKLSILIPLIRTLKNQFPNIILSISTSKYNIAKEALDAGVDIIVESIPLKYNEQMLQLIAKKQCPIVLTHNPSFANKTPRPLNSISDVIRDIQSNISFAIGQGIKREKVIIDPGIGFGRSTQDNFLILRQLSSFKYLNVPILVGLPRNSFLGEALRGKMRRTRISSIAANTMAIINGANIIRVYDVSQAVTMVNIIDAIRNVDSEI